MSLTFDDEIFAPIVLFTYNRPDQTVKILAALAENVLADNYPNIIDTFAKSMILPVNMKIISEFILIARR